MPSDLRAAMNRAGVRLHEISAALEIGVPTVSRILAGTYPVRRESARATVNAVRALVAARLGRYGALVVAHLVAVPRTPPPCGDPRHSDVRTCRRCKGAWMRAHRPKYAELTADQRRRANVRSHANTAQSRGQLLPQPCEVCGAASAEKHHDDYARPLEVRWLCPQHHRAHHRSVRRQKVPHETVAQSSETFAARDAGTR